MRLETEKLRELHRKGNRNFSQVRKATPEHEERLRKTRQGSCGLYAFAKEFEGAVLEEA